MIAYEYTNDGGVPELEEFASIGIISDQQQPLIFEVDKTTDLGKVINWVTVTSMISSITDGNEDINYVTSSYSDETGRISYFISPPLSTIIEKSYFHRHIFFPYILCAVNIHQWQCSAHQIIVTVKLITISKDSCHLIFLDHFLTQFTA